MNQGKWIVLKFGGSVLHGPEDFQDVQSDISRFIAEAIKSYLLFQLTRERLKR